ncbi:MAG TPA: GvpL/GvpF family gas vesicle protein [Longimicrobiales bacterium]
MSDFVYLYGFAPADASPPSTVSGIGGRPVELVSIGSMAAVISRVPAETYDPVSIEARLQDLAWVAEQGVAHESVVAWFVDHAQILPAPLFTMYSADAALQQEAAARRSEIEAELQRLRNKREWDLKISYNAADIEKHAAELSPRIAELDREAAAAQPGKRYLIEKKRKDLLKTEARKAAQSLAREVLDIAARLAFETRNLPLPRTAEDLPVILYAALLVERDREVELIGVLEQQSARVKSLGVGVAFSGPWAPYRFTGEHERAVAG